MQSVYKDACDRHEATTFILPRDVQEGRTSSTAQLVSRSQVIVRFLISRRDHILSEVFANDHGWRYIEPLSRWQPGPDHSSSETGDDGQAEADLVETSAAAKGRQQGELVGHVSRRQGHAGDQWGA